MGGSFEETHSCVRRVEFKGRRVGGEGGLGWVGGALLGERGAALVGGMH